MSIDPLAIAADAFARQEKAWNAGDGQAYAASFAEDADFVDRRGVLNRGRAAIAAGHDHILSTFYKDSVIAYTVTDAREIAPGCVVAHVDATLDAPSGALPAGAKGIITAVFVDASGEWLIAAFQNTLVSP